MDTDFVKEISRFGMIILSIALLVFIGVGTLLVLFPHLVLTALSYVVGVGMLLFGCAAVCAILYALRRVKTSQ